MQEVDREVWEAIYFGGQRAGYTQTRIQSTRRDGQPVRKITTLMEIPVRRADQLVTQRIEVTSFEDLDGHLLECTSRTWSGGQPVTTRAVREDSRLVITTTTAGGTSTQYVALPPQCSGPYAVERALSENPLQTGQSRTLIMWVPVLNSTARVELEASSPQETSLLNGPKTLQPVAVTHNLAAGQSLQFRYWVDEQGTVQKYEMPAMDQVSYRVSRDVALGQTEAPPIDLFRFSLVPIATPPENPHEAHSVTYRIHLPTGDPARLFPETDGQTVRSLDDHTAEVTVRSSRAAAADLRPENGTSSRSRGVVPTPSDLAPNDWIQSDHPRILERAHTVDATLPPGHPLAISLERYVHQLIARKDYSAAFATAVDVLDLRAGDCTEHAVLLAALCRARQLPARVVIGLVYSEPDQAFAYHMWNAVWIGDRWVHLDATRGQGGVGAGHLEIESSDLGGNAPWSPFLTLVQVLGRLEIKVVSVDGSAEQGARSRERGAGSAE